MEAFAFWILLALVAAMFLWVLALKGRSDALERSLDNETAYRRELREEFTQEKWATRQALAELGLERSEPTSAQWVKKSGH